MTSAVGSLLEIISENYPNYVHLLVNSIEPLAGTLIRSLVSESSLARVNIFLAGNRRVADAYIVQVALCSVDQWRSLL